MAYPDHVENPLEYLAKGLSRSFTDIHWRTDPAVRAAARVEPQVRQVSVADLRDCLRRGFADFAAARDDVMFVAIIYPIAGLILAALASRYELLPMVFPLIAGFALLGPFAAVGLYEISRRLEKGEKVSWTAAVGVFKSRAAGAILGMGAILAAFFVVWLFVAYQISLIAFGEGPPPTVQAFLNQVISTGEGERMALIGLGVGALFAAVTFALSVVSFPLLLDRNVDLDVALKTSLRVVAANPGTMAVWGLMVVALLVLGTLPALFGLVVVLPVLGHASWHLYRKAVA